MKYKEAKQHLSDRQMFGIKLGLNNIKRLLKRIGNPERDFDSIHIAGTNGKGSTAAILSAVLTANGFKTGLYTSPHISKVNERFRIDGNCIGNADFTRIYSQLIPHLKDIPLTYFECTTALAFLWFSEQQVDKAVIEVGLGGRFDATNVISPVCSVITPIGFDHQEHLGNTLEEITREKCGIIKKDIPVISAVNQAVCKKIVKSAAEKKDAPYSEVETLTEPKNEKTGLTGSIFDLKMDEMELKNLHLPLAGSFQIRNACTALSVCSVLSKNGIRFDEDTIHSGFKRIHWPERFMLYRRNPDILVDVAHNEQGFFTLYKEIQKLFPSKKVLLVVGMNEERDWKNALRPILPVCAGCFGIPVPGVRNVTSRSFSHFFKSERIRFKAYRTVRKGLLAAVERAGNNSLIVCAGSHYSIDKIKKVVNSLDR